MHRQICVDLHRTINGTICVDRNTISVSKHLLHCGRSVGWESVIRVYNAKRGLTKYNGISDALGQNELSFIRNKLSMDSLDLIKVIHCRVLIKDAHLRDTNVESKRTGRSVRVNSHQGATRGKILGGLDFECVSKGDGLFEQHGGGSLIPGAMLLPTFGRILLLA